MAKTVIRVKNLGKEYFLSQDGKYYNLRDLIADIPKKILNRPEIRKKNKFWALKSVSFDVRQGEVLGIIGRNGAGKSTLLKVLARIVLPTKGRVEIYGRTASILEVGTGFHAELTGRENIYLSGAILGMKKPEIKRKFAEIVKFSEIGKFIDMPVKRYSSGMRVRLAFAVVAHLDAKILIIDEVLSVGDVAFRRKSMKKMHSMAKDEGRTVLFVSHSMAAVDSLCDRVILLEEGRLAAEGKTREVISEYMSDYVPEEEMPQIAKAKARSGNGKVKIIDFWIEKEKGKRVSTATTGDQCRFVFKYLCPNGKTQKDVDFGFGIKNDMDQPLFLHYTAYTEQELGRCPVEGKIAFVFDRFPLAKGKYKMSTRVTVEGDEADFLPGAINVRVEDGDFYNTGMIVGQTHSPLYVSGNWKLEKSK